MPLTHIICRTRPQDSGARASTRPKSTAVIDHLALTVADFDRDGWPDIYVINSGEGSKNRLYRNKGDGTFEEVAERMGIADLNRQGDGVCMGAVWGDYDNDGYEDMLLIKWGKPELFHNDGGHGFTRVTDQVGLPPWINAFSPRCKRPAWNKLAQTVKLVSGSAAARTAS